MVLLRLPHHANPRQQHQQRSHHQPRTRHRHQEAARQPLQLRVGVGFEHLLLPLHVLRASRHARVEEVFAFSVDESDHDYLGTLDCQLHACMF